MPRTTIRDGASAIENPPTPPRVAIVHEWLTAYAGSERVFEQLLQIFPNADLFSLVDFLGENERAFLQGRKINTSFLQRLPLARKLFRKFLWLLPAAIESFDVSSYDIVISSSHSVAKGVITGPNTLHICYCHSPMRYAWDLQHEYLRQANLSSGLKGFYSRAVLHYMRMWDLRTANGVDCFVANSRFIGKRINKVYRRESQVIHPPVDTEAFSANTDRDDYYITVSRLVPYKRIDLLVEAFSQTPERKLIIVGTGSNLNRCKEKAPSNVQFVGHQTDRALKELLSRAQAFVFAAEEDFGICLVEAMACGTPVICLGRGGALDIITAGETGVFFYSQDASSILEAIVTFENNRENFDPQLIRAQAEKFSVKQFKERFRTLVTEEWTRSKGFNGNKESLQPNQTLLRSAVGK